MKMLRKVIVLSAALMGAMLGIALTGCEGESHVHEFEWTDTKPATCTVAGERTGTCTHPGCKEVKTEPIPALGHVRVEKTEKKATCKEVGVVRITCSRCNELNETRDIPMLNHIWRDLSTTVADCENPSISHQKCSLCGDERDFENMPALGHDWQGGTVEKEATCETDGLIKDATCSRCGTTKDVEIPHPGHKWTTNQVVKQPTCYEEGTARAICTVCGKSEDIPVEKLPHDWASDYVVDKVPTFTEAGKKSVHCKNKGCPETRDEVVIPMLVEGVPTDYEFRLVHEDGTRANYTGGVITLYDEAGSEAGKGTFTNGICTKSLPPAKYKAVLSDLPEKFGVEESYDIECGAPRTEFKIQTAVLLGTPPRGTKLKVGSIAYEFTVTTTDGEVVYLSDLVAQYKLVMLNFWATWCGPCKNEFPGLSRAYDKYKDSVYVLAMSTEPTDTMAVVKKFKSDNKLSFSMGRDDAGMYNYYNQSNSIPLTVFINSQGVVTMSEVGSKTQSFFEEQFAYYANGGMGTENMADRVLENTEYLPPKEEI